MALAFDGITKTITITTDVELDVKNLWSRWIDWWLTSDNSKYELAMSQVGGNDIDVTFSTVTRYLNDQHFTHGSADVSLGEASVYFDNCRIEGPVCPV